MGQVDLEDQETNDSPARSSPEGRGSMVADGSSVFLRFPEGAGVERGSFVSLSEEGKVIEGYAKKRETVREGWI